MPIPKEILAVKRPSSTVVKRSGKRFIVVKRTSRRVNGKPKPVDIGVVGEIVDGKFVEKRGKTLSRRRVDIKDYGEVALCNKLCNDLLQQLADVYDTKDAVRIYVIALLRAAYGDVKNRDLQMHYLTSFASENYPGVHLSENTIASFLMSLGMNYSLITQFMRNRVQVFSENNVVIDGMLKDYNSKCSSLSEFSRKGAKKGSMDISLLYAYDPKSKEPIAAEAFAGNILDGTAVKGFVERNNIEKGLIIGDKGFGSKDFLSHVDAKKELAYLIPLKQNSTLITKYDMDNPTEHLSGFRDKTILYKKVKMNGGNYLYSFRDPKMAYEQEVGYVEKTRKKNSFSADKYSQKRASFGLIVFKSKVDLEPLDIYLAYAQRWEIETMFDLYKNIMERDTVNVHSDYSLYGTEFINFLSVIMTTRVKDELNKRGISQKYSYKQVFKYLSKYKKVRYTEGGKWHDVTMLKYIEEMVAELNV